MIIIDGSEGEAGGQMLRTSLGLSALTKQPFIIKKIRAKRENPGLREQHLQAIRSVKKLCCAEVVGDELYSKELKFIPNEISKKKLNIKIGTAGSTALILQTLFLASLGKNLRIRIDGGGTFNKHAPSIIYLKYIFIPLLKKINANFEVNVNRDGFYPTGDAIVEARINKSNLNYLDILERGKFNEIKVISIASKFLKQASVANRQANAAALSLEKHFSNILKKVDYVDSSCAGSGILVVADYENTFVGNDVVGEKGKQSEIIGKEVADGLLKILESEATLDNFMVDQILPFLAAGKGGKFKFLELTEHARTNIEVIKKFLDVEFKFKENVLEILK